MNTAIDTQPKHVPVTQADMYARLNEHMQLQFPVLQPGAEGTYETFKGLFYKNGDMIRFLDAWGDLTPIGAIKSGRRWLVQNNSATFTGVELKDYMRLADYRFVSL